MASSDDAFFLQDNTMATDTPEIDALLTDAPTFNAPTFTELLNSTELPDFDDPSTFPELPPLDEPSTFTEPPAFDNHQAFDNLPEFDNLPQFDDLAEFNNLPEFGDHQAFDNLHAFDEPPISTELPTSNELSTLNEFHTFDELPAFDEPPGFEELPDLDDPTPYDASVLDTHTLDASVLGTPTLNASVLDASVLDASVLDASVLDASVLDASVLGTPDFDLPSFQTAAFGVPAVHASDSDASLRLPSPIMRGQRDDGTTFWGMMSDQGTFQIFAEHNPGVRYPWDCTLCRVWGGECKPKREKSELKKHLVQSHEMRREDLVAMKLRPRAPVAAPQPAPDFQDWDRDNDVYCWGMYVHDDPAGRPFKCLLCPNHKGIKHGYRTLPRHVMLTHGVKVVMGKKPRALVEAEKAAAAAGVEDEE